MKRLLYLLILVSAPLLGEIRAVVFDCGGVILHHIGEPIPRFLREKLGVPEEELNVLFLEFKKVWCQGLDDAQFLEQYAKAHGRSLPASWREEWEEAKQATLVPIPGMLALVHDLKESGYRVAMLSNVSEGAAYFIRQRGFYAHFAPVLLSCDLGLEKPDPRIYALLLETLQLPASECLFIDDRLDNVEAARACCIDSILFVDREQLDDELERRHIPVVRRIVCPRKS